ncbi:hypothetical protein [Billgrantia lactosivorans]|uniref:hypothetical protein n=1 Tax=Billgrantia lactosivorans TaxID=2185141 RepID=UPI000DAD63AC|nr:hypothetical protein [Halomonas lactosivorans]
MSDTQSRASSEASAGHESNRHGIDPEEIRHQAEETRDELREAARMQAESLLDRQKAAAAEQAERVSTVLHKMADEFERQEQPYFSGCVNELARRSDSFSRTLRERDLETLVEQTRHYTRQHPALFMGGAIAAGFMLSRFMRSSSRSSDATRH